MWDLLEVAEGRLRKPCGNYIRRSVEASGKLGFAG